MRTHTQNKRFQCPTCSYQTTDPSNFRKHIKREKNNKTSSTETLYKCTICSKQFKTQGWFIRHQPTHHNSVANTAAQPPSNHLETFDNTSIGLLPPLALEWSFYNNTSQ